MTETPAAPTPPPAPVPVPAVKPRRRWLITGTAIAIAVVAAAWRYWPWTGTETTDDAFIDGNIVPLSASIAGRVVAVTVEDNQHVNAGEVVARLDPAPLQARLDQAAAALQVAVATEKIAKEMAQIALASSDAARAEARAALAAKQADLAVAKSQSDATAQDASRAEAEHARYASLSAGAVTADLLDRATKTAASARSQADAATSRVQAEARAVDEAQAKLTGTESGPHQVAAAQAGIARAAADRQRAQAGLDEARIAYGYQTVTAPFAGRVARRDVQLGSYIQPGQALMAVVSDDLWVVANLKESQLKRLQMRQSAEIYVDAYPQAVFHAHVDSVQPGSGSRFSLLPPENATGNYVKVVQRVPVKLVFDEPIDLERYHLGPGMSVEPVISVR